MRSISSKTFAMPMLGFRGLPGSAGACANRMRRQKETELVPLLPPPPLHTHKRGVVLLWCAGLCRGEAGGTGGGRSRRECPRHRHVRRTTRSAPVPVGSRAPPALLPLCLFLDFYHTFACRKRDVQQYDSKFTTCSLTQNCHDCTRLVTLTLAASPISATFPPPPITFTQCVGVRPCL